MLLPVSDGGLLFRGGFKPPLVVFHAFSFLRISMIVIYCIVFTVGILLFMVSDYL